MLFLKWKTMIAALLLLGAAVGPGPAQKDKDERKSKTNSLGMKLLLIPKGEFMMGSEELPSEKPVHKVRITREFYMAANAVTVGQFRAFVKDTGYKTEAETSGKGALGFDAAARWVSQKPEYTWKNPGFDQGDDHPVVCVSWNDAIAFCKWLSKKDGKTYRLPTEAEFEYACRAGTTTRFSSGEADESLKGVANLADAALKAKAIEDIGARNAAPPGNKSGGIAAWDDGYAFTSPVGKYKPNPWGLNDMHGNVWTWCHDFAVNRYPADTTPVNDPQGPVAGTGRCIRGGTWFIGPLRCRSANRVQRDPAQGFCFVGFRVACGAE
jgi:formylglycine-generating enzyme required for sulfatase activity